MKSRLLASAVPVLGAVLLAAQSAFSGLIVALLRRSRPTGRSASLRPRAARLPQAVRSFGLALLAACLTGFLAAPRLQAAAGDADTPVLTLTSPDGSAPYIWTFAVQPDGKTILGGRFASVNGVARRNLARLNADGTVDLGWDPVVYGTAVLCVAVEADGKVLLGGIFTELDGVGGVDYISCQNVARLNANGSVDQNFNPMPATGDPGAAVYALAVQPDGKFLIGGNFDRLESTFTIRRQIARFNRDGTLDTSFSPSSIATLRTIVVQADGKILRGGDSAYGRLNADGTGDGSFASGPGPVKALAVQADGKVIVGGDFDRRLIRVNADGSADTGFIPRPDTGGVNSLALQVDGKIVLGGGFAGIAPNYLSPNVTVPRGGVARLQASGALDPFDPRPNSANGLPGLQAVALQADGKVLIAGNFNQLQPNGSPLSIARPYFARLLNDAAAQAVTFPSVSQVLWTRGGAAPELTFATFELSTNGGTSWAALPGTATRVGTTPNWQLTGLTLPAVGQIRARGRVISSGSTGLVESVIFYSFPPEIAVSGNGVNIAAGASTPGAANHTDFGPAVPGATTVVRTFTITNLGMQALNLTGTPRVAVSGAQAADFAVTAQPTATVAPNSGTTTFQVTFSPAAAGVRTATLRITSNDADEGTFDFAIAGRGLSYTEDTDGDGMSDAAEFLAAGLGFNWQVSQPALVQTYYGTANAAGLYTAAQVQALSVNTPLIQRNPATGQFTLVLGLKKSTDLQTFSALPFSAGSVSINGTGQIVFTFSTGDNAAFFRLQSP